MKLPDKPSRLIRLALNDLKKVEKDENYRVIMHQWHKPYVNDLCEVCLAGAVIAKSLNCPPNLSKNPGHYSKEINNKLLALDAFRTGNCVAAFYYLDLNFDSDANFSRNITYYVENKKLFYKDMRKLARDLEKGGY